MPVVATATAGSAVSAAETAPLEVAYERTLIVDDYPFLKSHVMGSKAVIPAAVIMEWLACGAISNNPGLSFHGFHEFRVYNGVVLDPTKPPKIKVLAGKAPSDVLAGKVASSAPDSGIASSVVDSSAPGSGIASSSLISVRVELRGGLNFMKLHAAANVLLSPNPIGENGSAVAPAPKLKVTAGKYDKTVEEAYKEVLFHGVDFEVIKEVEISSEDGIVAQLKAAPKPSKWMNEPFLNEWFGDPLAVDGVFQLMILWTNHQFGDLSLPNYVKNYRQYVSRFPEAGVKVVISAKRKSGAAANADVEFIDSDGNLVAELTGYECTMSPSLGKAFQGRTLL